MPKSSMDIDIGDILYIENAKVYKKVTNIRQWFEYWNTSLTAGQTLSNVKLTDLDPGDSYMYFIESVEVLRDVLLSLKFRNTEMQGSQGTGNITITENGLGDPYMLNKFTYNEPWYARVTENHGLVLTNQNIAMFKGIEIEIASLTEEEKAKVEESKIFTPVPG